MQTLTIRERAKVKSITNNIIDLIRSESCISVCAIGEDAISQTISSIDITKKFLRKEGIFLNIRPRLSEREIPSGEIETSITFEIISSQLFIEMAA